LNAKPNHITISEWVSSYSDDLYRWAVHKTSDPENAKDLVQETFIAAFDSLDKFQGKSKPKTWLFSILNNKVMDYHRKKFRETNKNQLHDPGNENEDDSHINYFDKNGSWNLDARPANIMEIEGHLLDNEDFRIALKNCMDKLPANWFSAIHLKYLENRDSKEICQDLGISTTNYWQVLHRAKLQIRSCLENAWFKL